MGDVSKEWVFKFLYTLLIFGCIAFAVLTYCSSESLIVDVGASLLYGIIATLLYLSNETQKIKILNQIRLKEKSIDTQNYLNELKELRFLITSKSLNSITKEKLDKRIEQLIKLTTDANI